MWEEQGTLQWVEDETYCVGRTWILCRCNEGNVTDPKTSSLEYSRTSDAPKPLQSSKIYATTCQTECKELEVQRTRSEKNSKWGTSQTERKELKLSWGTCQTESKELKRKWGTCQTECKELKLRNLQNGVQRTQTREPAKRRAKNSKSGTLNPLTTWP